MVINAFMAFTLRFPSNVKPHEYARVPFADIAVIYVSVHGTHQGSLWGIAPIGKRMEGKSVTLHCMVGGKVVERWYGDAHVPRLPDPDGTTIFAGV